MDTENVVDVVQYSKESTDLNNGNTKQLFSKCMAEHIRANSSGLSSEQPAPQGQWSDIPGQQQDERWVRGGRHPGDTFCPYKVTILSVILAYFILPESPQCHSALWSCPTEWELEQLFKIKQSNTNFFLYIFLNFYGRSNSLLIHWNSHDKLLNKIWPKFSVQVHFML